MIRVVDVVQHYGIRPVLRGVNLEVKGGELLALMGPNGMGKSTLLSVMAGALWPQRGYVEIGGMRRRSSEENELAIRKKVAYLPADPWLPTGHTGREFLLAVGRLYGVDELRLMEHIDRLLELFDLTAKGDSPIGSYSTGQTKKIALASVFVTEAPILLLDEPFSGGLDPAGIIALKSLLQRLSQGDDMTFVIAVPVPEIVEELADRIAIIADGQIKACDTVAGLRQQTGCSGSLQDVLEKLLSPATREHIDNYFKTRS
ncbi:ABC transporter ATP-binding protein [bacterium]|nr:ABC transporter ATP-binding protein [bacterium]